MARNGGSSERGHGPKVLAGMVAVVLGASLTFLPASAQDTTTSESTTTTVESTTTTTTTQAPPASNAIVANPACPSPYQPVDYQFSETGPGYVAPGPIPQGVPGTTEVPASVGAVVTLVSDIDQGATPPVVFAVELDGTSRTFTTGDLRLSGDYNRTPGPTNIGVGDVTLFYATDGALYVVLEQNNSWAYAHFAWRFDDPCVGGAAGTEPVVSTPHYTG